ncbi:hypothetical protein JOC75_001463 [Metabacillus crassostreae]|uniref:hypothetical protein n=1 Tax=Metabacillus crassostreae TaxID=929098 RepID=UPI00195C03ED|nr:hypothetical protein [Metabacillus crassostreae]MBM7603493.1 hypothetical protein [Metabacillus crassostreae]
MKKLLLLITFIPVIVLSSCDNIFFSKSSPTEDIAEEKQLLFFSDDDNIDREAVYYEALLDIKKDYPEKIEKMQIYSEKKDHKLYNVDTYPTLLVVDKEEVVVHIEGAVFSKEEILESISNALSKE